MRPVLVLLAAAELSYSQTQVNLANQSRNVDFASFPATRPWKTSASLPSTCQQGEALFLTTGAPGQQLYLCTAANLWNLSTSAALQDLQPVKSAPDTLLLGPACSTVRPCQVRYGNRVFSIDSPATLTLSGSPSTGTIYAWIDSLGLRAGHSGTAVLSCNSSCDVVPGVITDFPIGSLPLAVVPYSGNVVSLISGTMDRRAFISGQSVQPGPSGNMVVTLNGVTGASEVDLSSTIDLGGLSATRVLRRGTSTQRPAACTVGDLYHQTNNGPGIYECLVANQWRGPLASLGSVASMEARVALATQSGNATASTVLAAGHSPGWYRICSAATIRQTAASGALDLALSWRSPAQGTNLTAVLASISVTAPTEGWGCRILSSTGTVDVTVDPSDAGTAQYDLVVTAERLQ